MLMYQNAETAMSKLSYYYNCGYNSNVNSNVNIWKKLYIICYQLINYQSIKVKDLNGEEDVFRKIVNMMPTDDCRYALYDCSWESKDSPKEDLVFIMWAPEHSTIKKKMKYASSKQYIKAKFQGLKFEWQVNDMSDAKDSSVFIDKLGGRGVVKRLEGREV
uniref:ADF-H domain-containing protein n=1 Tax=Oncorhynchus kisutch TaxID=8019 RepID=A0A8C7LCE9_ONCKI